jgi:hypothetical protein
MAIFERLSKKCKWAIQKREKGDTKYVGHARQER